MLPPVSYWVNFPFNKYHHPTINKTPGKAAGDHTAAAPSPVFSWRAAAVYLPRPQTRCRCHGRELLYLVGTRLSLSAQFHLQRQVSDIWSAQESRSSVALVRPPPLPLRGVEGGRGSLAQGERKKSLSISVTSLSRRITSKVWMTTRPHFTRVYTREV